MDKKTKKTSSRIWVIIIVTIVFMVPIILFLNKNKITNLFQKASNNNKLELKTETQNVLKEKKVLFVNSYHSELLWSIEISNGILKTLNIKENSDGSLDFTNSLAKLKIIYMDTKRNQSEEFKKQAALKAKAVIEEWKPDVVIAADDNASKYLIVPFFKDTTLPFVFCGVNWDCFIYGFPCKNVTGMIEVTLIKQTIELLKKYSKGNKVGIICSNTESEQKSHAHYRKVLDLEFVEFFATNFEELKTGFISLQKKCDIIILGECLSVKGFDQAQMRAFINENTYKPTGSVEEFLKEFVLMSCAKTGFEQGEWSANTALQILKGKSPTEIPVAKNKKAKIYLNMELAKKLEIIFPIELIENAEFVE